MSKAAKVVTAVTGAAAADAAHAADADAVDVSAQDATVEALDETLEEDSDYAPPSEGVDARFPSDARFSPATAK